MATPPNMQSGSGGRRKGQRKAYQRSQRRGRRSEQRAATQERQVYKPTPATPGPAGPPAPAAAVAPKYGPSMQRAQADANFVYGDPILRAQAQGVNAGSWFDQYKADAARLGGQAAARYAQAQAQVGGMTPTQGPAVQSPEGDQAAASRGIQNQGFANLLTAQGAAQQDYFGGRELVGSAAQLQARQQAAATGSQLERDKASYTVQQRGKYRAEKHTQALENKAFGLDVAKATADVKTDRKQIRLDRRKARQDARKTPSERKTEADLAFFRKHGYYPPTGPPKTDTAGPGKSKFTPSQQASARKDFRKVFQDVKRNDNGIPTYPKDIAKTLTAAGADSLLVRAAVQLYKNGRVSPRVAKALFRDYGIKVKPRKPQTRPEPYSPPADSPGSDAAQP